ncbi:hypothetical protein [Clostridium tyrobutyricum]|uniref:hypothetical protein n=1 Tax=Clostridium tyrobutyricum TaxID=1519 RepID=UPI002B214DAB|nr:hypothetical protein [Clostridium tyrobutyricum]MEA5008214.1 hypothetical protein [Clostridium tyrobutyricum]
MTIDGMNLLFGFFKNNLLKCQVLVNGNYVDVPIQKYEQTSNSIKIFVYIDETVIGNMTQYRLISIDGKVFDTKSDTVTKDDRGLLTLFEYQVQEG